MKFLSTFVSTVPGLLVLWFSAAWPAVAAIGNADTSIRVTSPQPLRAAFDLSTYRVTGLWSNAAEKVEIDLSLESGIAEAETGKPVATFQLYTVGDDASPHTRLLKILSPRAPGGDPFLTTNAYFFLSRTGTNDFRLLGISDFGVSDVVDPDSPFLRASAKAFFAPQQVSESDLDLITDTGNWVPPLRGSIFQRSFISALTRRLIETAATRDLAG